MASENANIDAAEISLAIAASATRRAFDHLSAFDIRTATVLSRWNMVKGEDWPHDAETIKAALADPNHSSRVLGPPGPMLFYYLSDDRSRRYVIPVADLILSPRRALREAVLHYLSSVDSFFPVILSSRSRHIIAAHSPNVRSENAEQWVDAAMSISDGLRNDFYFCLAGVRQGLESKFDDG